jgi:hypothetical protein
MDELNFLKPKLIKIIFNNPVRTSKKTKFLRYKDQLVNGVEVKIMSNRSVGVQNAKLLIIKTGGTYSYHWALKDQYVKVRLS